MTLGKHSGLGDNFYIAGYDLSGDVSALTQIGGGPAALDVTPIKALANTRIGGLRDGDLQFTSFFESGASASNPVFEHDVLKLLPTADVIATYFRGTGVGFECASCIGKQINYDPTRDASGNLTMAVEVQANGFGLEWGTQLTSGLQAMTNSLTGQNSGFEGGIGNWTALTNCAVAESSAQHHTGSDSMSMTSTAGGDMVAIGAAAASYATEMFAVVPGSQVNVQAWFRSAVSARTCATGVTWYTSGGSLVSTTYGTGAADTTSGWTLVTATVFAPATSAWGIIATKVQATGGASEVHYVDDAEFFTMPAALDTAASASFGGQAYLQVTAFTGTDATISIWDSADNVTFAAVSGMGFTQITATATAQRISISNTATIRRYVTAQVVTAAGFTALSFGVQLTKNPISGQVF